MANLTQKEKYLLQDQKGHEELCIKKYTNYADQAQDPQLKQVFTNNAKQEQQHLSTINQMLSGQTPNTNQSQQQNQQQGQQAVKSGINGQGDKELCEDMLMTEKYVSNAYNTAIFEFRDPNMRQALNHIQKEEQEHGEAIYNYMESKGMYNVQ